MSSVIKQISTILSYKNTANVTDDYVPRKKDGQIVYKNNGKPEMVKAVERDTDGKVVYTDNIRVTFLLNEDEEVSAIDLNPREEKLLESTIRQMKGECERIGRTLKFKPDTEYDMKPESLKVLDVITNDDGVEQQLYQVTFTPKYERFVTSINW